MEAGVNFGAHVLVTDVVGGIKKEIYVNNGVCFVNTANARIQAGEARCEPEDGLPLFHYDAIPFNFVVVAEEIFSGELGDTQVGSGGVKGLRFFEAVGDDPPISGPL